MLGRNVAGETQGGLANVSIEQVLVWNPDVIVTIDQEFAATVRNDPSWAVGQGGARQPRASVAQNAVRLGGFSAIGQPPDRAVVARQDALPGALSGRSAHADAGFLHALLSRHAVIGANRPCTCGPGLIAFARMNNARSAVPGFAIADRGADRRPVAGAHRRPLPGGTRRPPQRALRESWPATAPTSSPAVESVIWQVRGPRVIAAMLVGRGARGRRHCVSGPVSQSAGLARYSRGIVGRGAWRGGRHLSLARRVRDPGHRLCRRPDRGRASSM